MLFKMINKFSLGQREGIRILFSILLVFGLWVPIEVQTPSNFSGEELTLIHLDYFQKRGERNLDQIAVQKADGVQGLIDFKYLSKAPLANHLNKLENDSLSTRPGRATGETGECINLDRYVEA